jgi:hypothetical protein
MTAEWRTAPSQGAWRIELADYQGFRISLRYTTNIYQGYLDGRCIGTWRNRKEAAAAVESTAARYRRPNPKPAEA